MEAYNVPGPRGPEMRRQGPEALGRTGGGRAAPVLSWCGEPLAKVRLGWGIEGPGQPPLCVWRLPHSLKSRVPSWGLTDSVVVNESMVKTFLEVLSLKREF